MRPSRFIGLLLVLLTLLVYLPVWQHGFVAFDDQDYVVNNRMVRAGLTSEGVIWAFTTFHASNWHPLTWLSHMLDATLFGPNAGAHHLTSVLLHALNAFLLYLLWLRLTGKLWPAAVVAALFAWHPLHVESVAWVAERKDVLSTCLGLLSLLAYVQWEKCAISRRGCWFWLAVLCFALSLMAKPMLVTLPFLLLLLDYWPLGRMLRSDPATLNSRAPGAPGPAVDRAPRLGTLLLEKWPFVLLTIGACIITLLAQRTEAMVSVQEFPLRHRLGNAAIAYGTYLAKFFWPMDLAALYPAKLQLSLPALLGSLGLLAGVSGYAIRTASRRPYGLVGWLWFLGTLVPVIGLVQVGSQALADRYTYVPLIGIFVMVVFGADELAVRWPAVRRALGPLTVLILLACLGLTTRQLRYWQDSEQLFRQAIRVTADNAPAQAGLGDALARQGRYDEALIHFREALRLAPASVQAHNDLANLLVQMDQPDEALEHYRAAVSLNPNQSLVRCNLGLLLVKLNRFEEAIEQYRMASQLDPRDPRPHRLTGNARRLQHRTAEAAEAYRQALARDGQDVDSLVALARILASDPDPTLRNGPEAVQLAESALAVAGVQSWVTLETLAMAYAEVGRFSDAQKAMQLALQQANGLLAQEQIDQMETRLKLFQTGQPYRESPNR